MLEGQYDSKKVENKIYKLWEESGFFNPDNLPNAKKRKSFTIIMPPTNANGNLHAGHALVMTIEDIMTRYKRMNGFKALWLPGLDHAGFETQVVYEKKLEKEGRSRFQIPKEQLYKEIWDFTQENKVNIKNQVRKMGASCDWSREKFTLDQDIVKVVYETFENLYKDGLIYRGKKIVNWCPKHQTSLSDLETKDDEKIEKFYYLKYGPFTIATSRPETKFGDKYVVMHPDDKRYIDYKNGQKIDLEWINGPITATVIKDKAIDMEFGTGAMTITPWHDAVDFDMSERHNLDKEQIIDLQSKLLPIAGEFTGMKILEARPKIIEKLQSKGLVEKIDENYKHVTKTCYKCNTLIEPQIMSQWFLKMKPLAEPATKAIQAGKIKFIPEHYKKIALHWLKNILDWPLSRQIAWGIPMPIKICENCGENFVDINNQLQSCTKCNSQLKKDPDTLDTWFSSGQWPFATLMNTGKNDFNNFYPTDVMETAGEIIFFWVSRMIMLGIYRTGKIPFKNVYLHGLVLDAKGQKMSKSKGNVINPLDLIEKYGTDALRISLVMGNTPGTSLALDENKIRGYKNFANKIWNAGKFVLMNTAGVDITKKPRLSKDDAKYLAELNKSIAKITKQMDNFKFYLAAEDIYHYFWHVFCDKIIEEKKKDILGEDLVKRDSAKWLLLEIYATCLQLLHPFMPFITEEIYQQLSIKNKEKCLMIEKWPD
ncbi:MAG: valine--tRNA ligase [Candidatus Staskawiczbacteria bacterium RIFOXYB1_FULL_32_11]|uniref:Valine--tRNA ligase n=1 Tax=Candidatus Staskawiczbacteria bacterium RIFOXYD1_FULL_32_13 TaxID=1802234 RepID=A0A1G2JK55_9BACT|nr:MAG: Valyl-tRNA synthetase [Parcubacteria group bacterium GW2011_GWC2_32_10]OGZ78050.1 MAG: valine--tRNA ligase [Candidatus Staskawiczbacteria bacterium RIFOXYB1_FULL_32_11]OGZ80970.1 MAG: valine--tRNA ligase [Candidatus Staskawiczbacteria bacterium RIFOXYA2_FULL_32_7]OGZ85309.1 MAG: valine--tRNA ligase [Candidatus Staskawiczbacteria bacterium RIFOXYC2_FULL_32_10]OGZ87517.1 MAG: valine--tRNA ligase [Candidatus Staskawiczbacteria bacterium RIFOXYD1_FULL_32_13]